MFVVCGRKNDFGFRISGGGKTEVNEYPWMVLVKISSIDYKRNCGGTLISNEYVVTGADCVHR